MLKTNKTLGGALIVAGTCIGAGMLAFPVVTAPIGYFYAIGILMVAWFFMYLTGLYAAEVNLSLAPENNYVSMARETLGKFAAFITWILFILLLYSLLAAFSSSGSDLLSDALEPFILIPESLAVIIWVLIFAFPLYFGIKPMDLLNRLLIVGLVSSYAFVVALGSAHIDILHYQSGEGKYIFSALPILLATFGYQIVVPSLVQYMRREVSAVKIAILLGSLIPLFVYLIWESIIFGIIPVEGAHSLTSIAESGHVVKELTRSLQQLLGNSWVAMLMRIFIFFAIATSFLGVSIGLFDFMADSLKISKRNSGRLLLLLITFLPPVFYVYLYPRGFILALNYAGIFVALLNGALPVLMAYVGRYHRRLVAPYQVRGGKILLLLSLFFFLSIVIVDIFLTVGWLPNQIR